MSPDSLRRIEDALTRLPSGARFSSRTQLSEHLAVLAGVSSRTVRRAFDRLDVDHLIDPENARSPGVGQAVRQPDEAVGQLSDSRHETAGQTASAEGPSRVRTQAPTGPPPAAPAPAAPPAAGPPPAPPAPPSTSGPGRSSGGGPEPKVARMMSRSRRMPNKHRGFCTVDGCGEWVESGEGFIPLPYDPEAPTPLHCPRCWDLFAALDAAMALHEPIPDQINERKSP